MKKFILSACLLLAMAVPGMAQNLFEVGPGEKVRIDRHNICRIIGNSGNMPFMVPTRTASEWSVNASSFLAVKPRNATIDPCGYEAICPLASRNYSHVDTMTSLLGQISPDGNEYIGPADNGMEIWSRSGSTWSKKQTLPNPTSATWVFMPYRKFVGFSPDGTRAVAIVSATTSAGFTLIELNKNDSGVWSLRQQVVSRPVPNQTRISSVRFGGDSDTVIFSWNVNDTTLPAASIVKRGANGTWSINADLPRPSGGISPVDVWLMGDGTRAYLTGEVLRDGERVSNNFWIRQTVEYRLSNGAWIGSRINQPPHSISADGLTGVSADIPQNDMWPKGMTLYKRDRVQDAFEPVDSIISTDFTCCQRPTMSDDGTTVAVMQPGGLRASSMSIYVISNDRLVSRGQATPARGDFVLDFPSISATGDVVFNNGMMAHACSLS